MITHGYRFIVCIMYAIVCLWISSASFCSQDPNRAIFVSLHFLQQNSFSQQMLVNCITLCGTKLDMMMQKKLGSGLTYEFHGLQHFRISLEKNPLVWLVNQKEWSCHPCFPCTKFIRRQWKLECLCPRFLILQFSIKLFYNLHNTVYFYEEIS